MRLLNTSTLRLRWYPEDEPPPPYAALSHTWGADEVEYADLQGTENGRSKYGFRKLLGACQEAIRSHKLSWLWADTVCIDRSSSAELSEAINSTYRWFQNCNICLAYLDDLCTSGQPEDLLVNSRWMRRSWTLIELIAPRNLAFYNADWSLLGTKESLVSTLSRITQIDQAVLAESEALSDVSIGKRMSWAAQRSTRRIEDAAYSLLGLFGISMEIRYGEGSHAFMRLQDELLRTLNDASLFAWQSSDDQEYRGLLARSPAEFGHLSSLEQATAPWRLPTALRLTSTTPTLTCRLAHNECEEDFSMPLADNPTNVKSYECLSVKFRLWKGELVRWNPQHLFYVSIDVTAGTHELPVARDVDTRKSKLISQSMTQRSQRQIGEIFSPPSGNSLLDDREMLDFQPTGTEYCFRSRFEETESEGTGHVLSAAAQSSTGMSLPRGASLTHIAGTDETSVATPKGDNASVRSEAEDEVSDESSDYENYLFLSPDSESQPMELDPLFAELTDELVNAALDCFTAWITGRTVPCKRAQNAEASSSSCKRIKADEFLEHIPIESRELPEEEGTVFVDTPGSRSFACPFYLDDMEQHLRCLTRADLRTIRDLKKHLWTAHRQPYYCPTCSMTFTRASTRDEHIKARACSLQPQQRPPQGLSESQLQQMAKRSKPTISESDQWFAIWHLIHPETDMSPAPKAPRTPFLTSQLEFAVCVVRSYWARKGRQVIAEFLEQRNLRDYDVPDEERNLSALYQVVLDNVVDQLVQTLRDDENRMEPSSTLSNVLSSLRKFCSKWM
ncbi:heterokaryon incompatibility protein-domain-containing protein [Apiospora saccharicola]|uniref:Heterokaryon incompatibility protein-domain-containing protein n=1 Tax=Apiospora saccharicola TaxID=335842 RepID=A0ABR1V8A2_9PEZI